MSPNFAKVNNQISFREPKGDLPIIAISVAVGMGIVQNGSGSYSHPISLESLSINDYKGTVVMFNYGLGPVTYSHRAKISGNENFGKMLKSTYKTNIFGLNLYSPIPITFNRSITNTSFLYSWK